MSDQDDFVDEDSDFENFKSKINKKKIRKEKNKHNKKRRLVKNKDVNPFLDIMAEESEGEDESDIDEEDPQFRKEREEIKKLQQQIQKESAKEQYQPKWMKMDDENSIEKYYEQNVVENNYEEEEEEEIEESDLPTIRDPKIFAFRCFLGKEKEIVAQILYKVLQIKSNPGVFSAIYQPRFPGFVYIEAIKETSILELIDDIDGFFKSKNVIKSKIVSLKEVPQIYEIKEKKNVNLELGQWVRLKTGKYQGDLARVFEKTSNTNQITLKIVPRVVLKGSENQSIKNSVTMQKLIFDNSKMIGNAKVKYMNGFLIKKFPIKNLETENVLPTIEEIETFAQGELDQESRDQILKEGLMQIDLAKSSFNKFQKGEIVKVIAGELKSLKAQIIDITKDFIIILPQIKELSQTLQVLPNQLAKYFKEGQSVKIQDGKYQGNIGMVCQVNDRIATIILENDKQVKLHVNDLKLTNQESNTQNQVQIDFKRFDLIKLLNNNLSAIVIKSDQQQLDIIDENQHFQSISIFAVEKKINDKYNFYKNIHDQDITLDSNVKVLEGYNQNKIGSVKHIYNDTLYLYNPEFIMHSGIIVEKANNCYLISKNYAGNRKEQMNSKNVGTEKSLIGKKCIVIQGPYKAYEGIIKEVEEYNFRVSLLSKPKTITISKSYISVDGTELEPSINSKSGMAEGFTPFLNKGEKSFRGQSPFISYQSPGPNNWESNWNTGMNSPSYNNAFRQ